MKYFYSYYPFTDLESDEVFFNTICIKLSSTILRSLGKRVGIYTNKSYIDYLKKYEVSLDFYENIEEDISDIINGKLFALTKIYANSIQTEPFIQLDCDSIIFDNFDFDRFENTNIFYHFPENKSLNYNSSYDQYVQWKTSYSDIYDKINMRSPSISYREYMFPFTAYSCAILGGTDWKTLSIINKDIFNFIKNNIDFIKDNFEYPMPVLEQQLIVGALSKLNYKPWDIQFVHDINHNNQISFYWDDIFKSFANDDIVNMVFSTYTGQMLNQDDSSENQKSLGEWSLGFLHLNNARERFSIRNMIYSILKKYDASYISLIETKFGINFDFQKDLYKKLV